VQQLAQIRKLVLWQTSFHGVRVKIETQEVEEQGRPKSLLLLEMETQLFPKSENPLHRCTRKSGVSSRAENQPEVVKIVAKTCRNVT
jgi:hypothetical protein